jgi:hypothetical protein
MIKNINFLKMRKLFSKLRKNNLIKVLTKSINLVEELRVEQVTKLYIKYL